MKNASLVFSIFDPTTDHAVHVLWVMSHWLHREDTVTTNQYAPPKSRLADIGQEGVSPPIWNPNSAENWSLLFTPVFGAFLHMKNWEVLGEPGKASVAKVWALVSLLAVLGIPLLVPFLPNAKSLEGLARTIGFILLISWYFGSARGQAEYVKSHYGKNYPRKGWGQPLVFALLALVGASVFIVVIGRVAANFMHRV
jgi:ABC-type cobalt transport system substrate-binding protein